jgi:hypothetical protein
MEEKFKTFLTKLGLKGAPSNYPQAINVISQHYSNKTGKYIDIYSITDIIFLRNLVKDYEQNGRFSDFGYEHHGRYRAAIKKYLEFFETVYSHNLQFDNERPSELSIISKIEEINNQEIESLFTYEKDLQKSLYNDVESLFPEYVVFGNNKEGIEYSINGKRIDVLLTHKKSGDLLAIELKSGNADFKVFGQISMYLGLLKMKFPDKIAKGLIIAGSIDESLQFACSTSNLIALKTYKMKLQLTDI